MSKNGGVTREDSKKMEILMRRYSPLIPEAVSKHCLKKAGFQADQTTYVSNLSRSDVFAFFESYLILSTSVVRSKCCKLLTPIIP